MAVVPDANKTAFFGAGAELTLNALFLQERPEGSCTDSVIVPGPAGPPVSDARVAYFSAGTAACRGADGLGSPRSGPHYSPCESAAVGPGTRDQRDHAKT